MGLYCAKGFYRLGSGPVHPPIFEVSQIMIGARLDKTDWLIVKELQADGDRKSTRLNSSHT
jgi:hypothetical protein